MTPEHLAIVALVAVLSVVQSVFGMGLLVFGTPILVLAGMEFTTVLQLMVPASFSISVLQVLFAGPDRPRVSAQLYLLCLPAIALGLWLAADTPLSGIVDLLVAGVLLASALIRAWAPSRAWLTGVLRRHTAVYHLAMGLCHGLTNLGGALLAVLAGGLYGDKRAVRYVVAHYYLAFSIIQIAVLFAIGRPPAVAEAAPLIAVATTVYLVIGRRVFARTSDAAYQTAMTLFIAAFGVMVLLKS